MKHATSSSAGNRNCGHKCWCRTTCIVVSLSIRSVDFLLYSSLDLNKMFCQLRYLSAPTPTMSQSLSKLSCPLTFLSNSLNFWRKSSSSPRRSVTTRIRRIYFPSHRFVPTKARLSATSINCRTMMQARLPRSPPTMGFTRKPSPYTRSTNGMPWLSMYWLSILYLSIVVWITLPRSTDQRYGVGRLAKAQPDGLRIEDSIGDYSSLDFLALVRR